MDDKLRNRYKDVKKNGSYDDGGMKMITPCDFPFEDVETTGQIKDTEHINGTDKMDGG